MPVDAYLTIFSGFCVEPVGTRLNKQLLDNGYRGVAGFEDQRELWNPPKVYPNPRLYTRLSCFQSVWHLLDFLPDYCRLRFSFGGSQSRF